MKRFLAGILSAVLLMGSIPVYGAQDMGISPEAGYSVEGTELSQTEEALSGETALQETADTSNEENVEDSKENTEETPAPSEEEPDSQEPEIEPEIQARTAMHLRRSLSRNAGKTWMKPLAGKCIQWNMALMPHLPAFIFPGTSVTVRRKGLPGP